MYVILYKQYICYIYNILYICIYVIVLNDLNNNTPLKKKYR